jgi:hypothetical protein
MAMERHQRECQGGWTSRLIHVQLDCPMKAGRTTASHVRLWDVKDWQQSVLTCSYICTKLRSRFWCLLPQHFAFCPFSNGRETFGYLEWPTWTVPASWLSFIIWSIHNVVAGGYLLSRTKCTAAAVACPVFHESSCQRWGRTHKLDTECLVKSVWKHRTAKWWNK